MRDRPDNDELPDGVDDDLQLLRSSAVAAGILATAYFRKDIRFWNKSNASPVSEADVVVDHFLEQTLRASRPDYGWLSEESVDDDSRLLAARAFVVDPIDGTRGFLRGDDSWTVCIAVVEAGRPIAGVVYAPARDEMYEAAVGGGARLNGRRIKRPDRGGRLPLIPAPAAVHTQLQAAGLDYVRGTASPSLAFRLMQVAVGDADAAVARRGSNDWDIAAAEVILREAGVRLEDVCGEPLQFNMAETRHGALAAVADESLRSAVHAALRQVYGCPSETASTAELEHRHP